MAVVEIDPQSFVFKAFELLGESVGPRFACATASYKTLHKK